MKKITSIVIAFLFFVITANSQITKGNWMVGGSGSFSTNNGHTEGQQTVSFQFSPGIGYFFLNKFVAGIKLDLASEDLSNYTGGSGVGLSIKRFTAGPYTRYYFLDGEQIVNIFAEANYTYGAYSGKGYYTISKGNVSRYSFNAGTVAYFNSSVGIEFTIGYYNVNDMGLKNPSSGFNMGIGFQIHLEKDHY